MGKAPARPARFLKSKFIVAALIPALVILLAITGFVWAQKGVTVVVDGESRYMKTQAEDVAGLLSQAEITCAEGDVVSPAPDAPLSDGMSVVVRHAIPVTLEFSGESIDLKVVGTTVAEALIAAGADPGASLVVEPALDTPLTSGMTITANDVFIRIAEEEAEVPYETVTRSDPTLSWGSRSVVATGQAGTMLRVYRVLVTDGVEGARTLVTERVVTEPVDEIVVVGTKRVSSRIGRAAAAPAPAPDDDLGSRLTVTTTAYAPGVDGVGSRTATGQRAGYGIVAVDPSVIPLGTRLYIPGYGYGIAADTGGAIHGNKIDLCFDTRSEAIAWGRRTVTITILP